MNTLAIVMASMVNTAFDFVGEYIDRDERYIFLKNPLVLNYNENRMLMGLRPLHLPFGAVDVLEQDNVLWVPHTSVAYCVILPGDGDDWIHTQYYNFFEPPATITESKKEAPEAVDVEVLD